jgi:hypothetical protein
MTLGEGTGLVGLLRSWFVDRPNVKIVPKLRDYGEPRPGTVVLRSGLYLDVEVHSTGLQPIHVLEVGIEIGRKQFPLGRIDKTLTRPEFATVHNELPAVRGEINDRIVTGFYVTATPERVYRLKSPAAWRRFPVDLPPSEPGRDSGFIMSVG